MLYFFVEGTDDETFIKNIVLHNLKTEETKIIQYAQKAKKYVDNYLRTIKAIDEDDYIFLADSDGKDLCEKEQKLLNEYKQLEKEKIRFVVKEIESWYLAGISDSIIKLREIHIDKIKKINDTQEVDKEYFNTVFNKMGISPDLIFRLDLLSYFDVDKAKERNKSFEDFWNDIVEN